MRLEIVQRLVDNYNFWSYRYNRAINLKRDSKYCHRLGVKSRRAFEAMIKIR